MPYPKYASNKELTKKSKRQAALDERKRVDAHAAKIRGTKPGTSRTAPATPRAPKTPSRPRGEQVSEGLIKGTVMGRLTAALKIKEKDKKK